MCTVASDRLRAHTERAKRVMTFSWSSEGAESKMGLGLVVREGKGEWRKEDEEGRTEVGLTQGFFDYLARVPVWEFDESMT